MENYVQDQATVSYVITPPVKSMRVPIFKDPLAGTQTFGYLISGTIVKGFAKDATWLIIQIDESVHGYVQSQYTRPARSDDIPANQSTRGKSEILSIKEGLVGNSSPRGPNRGVWVGFISSALFSLVIAGVLLSVEQQECTTLYIDGIGGTTCNVVSHPLAPLASILGLGGCILGILGVLAFLGLVFGTAKSR